MDARFLPPFHPLFKEWTHQRAVDSGVTMPYHPGAVKFYRHRAAVGALLAVEAEVLPLLPQHDGEATERLDDLGLHMPAEAEELA